MLEVDVQPRLEAEFKAFVDETSAAAHANEPGTLNYEWSRNAAGVGCHIFERYADSTAVMVHLGTFREKFAARFREIVKPVRLVVYGSPNEEVKTALAGFSPVYMQSVGGFSR